LKYFKILQIFRILQNTSNTAEYFRYSKYFKILQILTNTSKCLNVLQILQNTSNIQNTSEYNSPQTSQYIIFSFMQFLVNLLHIERKITIQLQAWIGPYGSRRLGLQEFLDIWHIKVVTLSALHNGRLYPPGNIAGTHFC